METLLQVVEELGNVIVAGRERALEEQKSESSFCEEGIVREHMPDVN